MVNRVEVLNTEGQTTGSVELPRDLFDAKVSEYALYRAVVTYQANQRQGTASTKGRSEVCRTSKKHHRQKGTGGARRGSMRSPLVRGGGVAFGPKPRSYFSKLPKGIKRLAFSSALTIKETEGRIKVIDDFELIKPSTSSFQRLINACGLQRQKVLFVTPENMPVLFKSCRNLPAVLIAPVGTLCTHDIIAAETVLFTRQALDKLVQVHAQAKDAESRSDDL